VSGNDVKGDLTNADAAVETDCVCANRERKLSKHSVAGKKICEKVIKLQMS
jgi:hypothetical protein